MHKKTTVLVKNSLIYYSVLVTVFIVGTVWVRSVYMVTPVGDTLYELILCLEPTATNVLSFNAGKVFNATLSEQ